MALDAIKAALEACRDAWSDVEGDEYVLADEDQKRAVQKEIDDAILSLEEAARLALADVS